MARIERVWCIVDAVRVADVVTAPPVVETRDKLTYDVTVNKDGGLLEVQGVVPMGNRPAGNILVEHVGWGFSGFIVGGSLQLDIPEHRNAVKCPAPGEN